MRILFYYIFLLLGFIYSFGLMIIYPIGPIIEPTKDYEPGALEACINLFTVAFWLFLLLTFFLKKLYHFTNFLLVFCYIFIWLYYMYGKTSVSDDSLSLVILLTHLLCFLPLWTAKLLRRDPDDHGMGPE